MKKFCLVILMFIIFIPLVKAETEAELQQKLDKLFPNNSMTLNAVSPIYFTGDELNDYLSMLELKYFYMDSEEHIETEFDSQYKTATVKIMSNSENEEISASKVLNINWADYDETDFNKVKNYKSSIKKIRLLDLSYIYFLNRRNNNLTYLPNFEEALPTGITYDLISYGCGGFGGTDFEDIMLPICKVASITYDNIIYNAVDLGGHSNIYGYRVLYIPSNTKETTEDYIMAAKERLKKYYPNSNISISKDDLTDEYYKELYQSNYEENIKNEKKYREEELKFGYDNNFIMKDINTFSPFYADIKIDNENYNLIIAKGTDSQLINNIPKEFASQNNNTGNKQESSNNTNNNQENNNNTSNNQESNNDDEIENPQTGNTFPILSLIILAIISSILLIKTRNKKFYKI